MWPHFANQVQSTYRQVGGRVLGATPAPPIAKLKRPSEYIFRNQSDITMTPSTFMFSQWVKPWMCFKK